MFSIIHRLFYNQEIKSPQKDFRALQTEREMPKWGQTLRQDLKDSQAFDQSPAKTYRGRMADYEPVPHSYQDILTARESNMRSSCPREIKPDPEDIDGSFHERKEYFAKPKKGLRIKNARKRIN